MSRLLEHRKSPKFCFRSILSIVEISWKVGSGWNVGHLPPPNDKYPLCSNISCVTTAISFHFLSLCVGGRVRKEGEHFAQSPYSPSSLPNAATALPSLAASCGYCKDSPRFPGAQSENHWTLQSLRSLSNVTFGSSITPEFRMRLILPVFVSTYSWRGRLRLWLSWFST